MLEYYDNFSFEIQSENETGQNLTTVLEKYFAKTHQDLQDEQNKVVELEADQAGNLTTNKKGTSKPSKSGQELKLHLKEFSRDAEAKSHLEQFSHLTEVLFDVADYCFFSGGINLAYALIRRLFLIKKQEGSDLVDEMDYFLRKLVISDLAHSSNQIYTNSVKIIKLLQRFIPLGNPKLVQSIVE